MIIWLTALVLLGLLSLMGYYAGVIRVAISLLGLLVAAVLAVPLSPIVKPLLPVFGLKHPIWSEIVPPVIVFIVVMIIFKVIGLTVHRKVNMFHKYKTDDKVALKWERLSGRLGACLGLVNGAVYFVLVLIPFYVAGYLTTQVAAGEEATPRVRFINNARAQMHETKVDKVVAAYDPAPKNFYEAADVLGLLKNNRLLVSRLSRYPVFLSLAERKEFQDIANDVEVNQMLQTQGKLADFIKQPKIQAIITNAAIATDIKTLVGPDLKDLHQYLLTGKSEKYDDEKILGFWTLNIDASIAQEKAANPKLTPLQMKNLKQNQYAALRGTTFIAMTDNKAILKGAPKGTATQPTVLGEGNWKAKGSNYEVTLSGKTFEVSFEKGKMILPRDGMFFAFDKEL
ncbi:MAG: CvpA family protein [Verrucomicrobiota bacterium]